MKLISQINTNINLDKVKYIQRFEYKESPYASTEFPEIGNINLFNIVPLPPKNSSDTTKKELLYLSNLTKNLTVSQQDLVHKMDKNAGFLIEEFVDDKGLDFSASTFISMYHHSLVPIVQHLKFYYNRPRPYQLAELYNIDINRIVTSTHKTPAYPSGHTMYASLLSEILSDKYPEHKKQLNKLVDSCAKARELQGVHYPSDNEASKKIVRTIYPELKKYYIGVGYEL
jgi:acid phosphatase (class A)